MKRYIAKYIALLSLVLLTVPSILFLAGRMELQRVKFIMLISTAIWFIAATVWMWENNTQNLKSLDPDVFDKDNLQN